MKTTKTIFSSEYRKLIGWLTAERKYKNLSQTTVAERLSLPNHTYISKVESFERRLDVHEYVLWCEAIGIDAHEGLELLIKKSPDTLN